jgi:outer membrane protein
VTLRVSSIVLALAAAPALLAQGAATKVGVINIQQAVLATKDGQKAAQDLQTRFGPKRKEIEAKNAEIQSLQDQFRKSQNTASEEQRAKMARDIDQKQKSLQRDVEDAQAEFEQEQQRAFNELGGRVLQVLGKFARDNAYTLVLDVSTQQSPVLYMADGIDITEEVVKLYDANAPAPAAPAPSAAKPTTSGVKPAPTMPRPTSIAPVKPAAAPPVKP